MNTYISIYRSFGVSDWSSVRADFLIENTGQKICDPLYVENKVGYAIKICMYIKISAPIGAPRK